MNPNVAVAASKRMTRRRDMVSPMKESRSQR
jgi:hypothetical protein